jgi:putative membrane protein
MRMVLRVRGAEKPFSLVKPPPMPRSDPHLSLLGITWEDSYTVTRIFSRERVASVHVPRKKLLRTAAPFAQCPTAASASRQQASKGPAPVLKLIVRWLLLAAALLLVAHLYPGVTVSSFGSAMIAALVLGLLNTLVRPLLVLLTLPVTLLTLGLFLFVINALMFWSAASLLDGFAVAGFAAALIGSLIYSACGMVIDVAVEHLFARE